MTHLTLFDDCRNSEPDHVISTIFYNVDFYNYDFLRVTSYLYILHVSSSFTFH